MQKRFKLNLHNSHCTFIKPKNLKKNSKIRIASLETIDAYLNNRLDTGLNDREPFHLNYIFTVVAY